MRQPLNPLLDFLFPNFCEGCGTKCHTFFFCPDCFTHLQPIEPRARCIHCFSEKDRSDPLCFPCMHAPSAPIPLAYVFTSSEFTDLFLESKSDSSAFVGYLLYLWAKTPWPVPDVVCGFGDSVPLARELAVLMKLPYFGLFQRKEQLSIDPETLEEDQTLLLVFKKSTKEQLKEFSRALSTSFPKCMYALALSDST